jgi:uncharacterized protein with FMN-binding domain
MKKIVLWLMSTLTVLLLLFGYHTSTSSRASASGESSAVTPVTSGSSGTTSSGGSGGASSASTVTGDVADTRWGPVQVQLTVANGKVTDVSVVEYPSGNPRDQEINAQALPILVQETMQAQSANIDMVSGATVTSDGYLQSLQSALDRAGL